MKYRKYVRLASGILFAIAFVWLIVRKVRIHDVVNIYYGASLGWIIGAFVVFCIGYACRIHRWRLMLLYENPNLRWIECSGPLLAGFAINNVLPFRAGDIFRALGFNNRLGVTSGVVFATLYVERLLDFLVVIIFLGVCLAKFDVDAGVFSAISSTAILAIGVGIFCLLLFPKLLMPFASLLKTFSMFISPNIGKCVCNEIDKSVATLVKISKYNNMLRLIFWSFVAWIAEGCVFWFSALSLSVLKVPETAWAALPIGTLATLIPSTPGYVGTFDYFVIQTMSMLGNSYVAATAFALLVHILIWIPPTLIGGIFLLLHPVQLKRLTKQVAS